MLPDLTRSRQSFFQLSCVAGLVCQIAFYEKSINGADAGHSRGDLESNLTRPAVMRKNQRLRVGHINRANMHARAGSSGEFRLNRPDQGQYQFCRS